MVAFVLIKCMEQGVFVGKTGRRGSTRGERERMDYGANAHGCATKKWGTVLKTKGGAGISDELDISDSTTKSHFLILFDNDGSEVFTA